MLTVICYLSFIPCACICIHNLVINLNVLASCLFLFKDVEKMDIDNWDNIRGPRPWEDSKAVQDDQRTGKPTENVAAA